MLGHFVGLALKELNMMNEHYEFEGLKPLTIIPKHSILDVAAVLDPPLAVVAGWKHTFFGDISHGI